MLAGSKTVHNTRRRHHSYQLPQHSHSWADGSGSERSKDFAGLGLSRVAFSPSIGSRRRAALVVVFTASCLLWWFLYTRHTTTLNSNTNVRNEVDTASARAAAGSLSDETALRDVNVDPLPKARVPRADPAERYMAYFPHSGFHNQRIALENALALARILERTLLVPPVWLGLAIPFIAFDKMYNRLEMARKTGLMHCKDIPKNHLIPHECLGGYWDYTVVSWDVLTDMDKIAADQALITRWNTSYAWLEQALHINLAQDLKTLPDAKLYDYRFDDSEVADDKLGRFATSVNISQLRKLDNYKLLHFGSLFGTERLRLNLPDHRAARTAARQNMVLRNKDLDEAADAISARLGGSDAYFGAHVRMGDGVFRSNAANNALAIFRQLVGEKLGIRHDLLEGLLRESQTLQKAEKLMRRRDVPLTAQMSPDMLHSANRTIVSIISRRLAKHDPHDDLPSLSPERSRSDMHIHPSLTCRGPLHSDERLLILNHPVYLATDSKIPETDPYLRIFFDTFPCIFVLADFTISAPSAFNSQPIPAVRALSALRNKEDGVSLAPFYYPFVDALVASHGRDMVGTPGSTFSNYAVDVLHRVRYGWPIVERGAR